MLCKGLFMCKIENSYFLIMKHSLHAIFKASFEKAHLF